MTIVVIFTFKRIEYLCDLSYARFSVITTCPTSRIEYLVALKNLQYTWDKLMIYIFLLIILMNSTYNKIPSQNSGNFTHELKKQ